MQTSLAAGAIWLVSARNVEAESRLQRELGVPSLVASVLVSRGLAEPEAASRFLHASLEDLHSPELLPDYAEAAGAVLRARDERQTVFIHGDYDVDGVTSAALLTRFLGRLGLDVRTFVPHRLREGYGVGDAAVDEAHAAGARLFITCDCGVSAIEQVERAKSYGMRVVVTDHHTVGERLPRADAVVNPHRSDSSYPFRDLSGAGVVFKLCAGIGRELGIGMTSYYRAFLDLAALGTIADVMPLVGENRIIARFGMPQIKNSQKPGIRALLRASGLAERAASGLKAHHVSFVLGPRLNAAGRLDDAALSLSLLLSQDEGVAADLAARLEQLNELRRAEQERIAEEAIELVLATGRHDKPVIVVWGEDWHAGVVGIVASRLVERFRRPVFVGYADAEAGTLRASGRSITGFHLADAIRAHPELLEGGGHAMAAGFSASLGDAEKVEAALSEYGQKLLSEDDFVPKAPVDSDVEPSELTLEAVEAMSAMEPFGFGNAEPVMLVRGVAVADVLPTRNPEHPLVSLAVDGVGIVKAAAFGLGSILQEVPRGMRADALIKAGVDEWQGKRRVRWVLKDLRPEEQTTASTGELGLAHLADDEA